MGSWLGSGGSGKPTSSGRTTRPRRGGPPRRRHRRTRRDSEATRTVEAPYTDTVCLAYKYEKKRKSGDYGRDDHDSTWDTVASGRDGVPFMLADLALGTDGIEGGTRTRKIENRLEPGDPIHVYGQKRAAVRQREDELDQQRYYVGDGNAVSTYRITDVSETWAVTWLLGQGLFITLVFGVFAGSVDCSS